MMKTERISVLGTPEFKTFLAREAEKEGISISELVRRRCERVPSEDEALLMSMAAELKRAVAQAKRSLDEGLQAIRETLAEKKNNQREKVA
jgi:hypothetical protein